jgi:hypothetical protein
MKSLIISLVTILIFCSSPISAQVFCPQPPNCAPPYCPTQNDCNHGWTWASPDKPMVLYPVSFYRDLNGHLSINQCTLDPVAYPPWSNPRDGQAIPICGSSYPSSVSLQVWCDAVKALPLPGECSTLNCIRPSFVGVCGINVSSIMIPQYVKDTLSLAPTWVKGRQSERLNRVRVWVESIESKGN